MPDAPSRPHGWIVPGWSAPASVRGLMTTRSGGESHGPFGALAGGGMNLGLGSGDDRHVVVANRRRFEVELPSAPAWLHQVHGTHVVDAATVAEGTAPEADASWTDRPDQVCAVLVADCLPVLFCDQAGRRVAAAHAGWRGLVGGVLERTVDAARFDPATTMAWLGPSIGPTKFEVGDDVREAFVAAAGSHSKIATAAAFAPHVRGKWFADLPRLARLRLEALGMTTIAASGACTVSDPARYYSYRRDGVTGRMAAAIWWSDELFD